MKQCLEFITPGNKGLRLKGAIDKLIKSLTLPSGVLGDLKAQDRIGNAEDPNSCPKRREEIYSDGKNFLLSSFFTMMLYLKKRYEFAVVLRSFSDDIHLAVDEFNQFCNGVHPCYPSTKNPQAKFDGSKGNKRFLIEPSNFGCIYRQSDVLEETYGVFGAASRVFFLLEV